MLVRNLKFIAETKSANQSQLARFANLSRQRVSQWMKQDEEFINIETRNLLSLCEGLGVTPNQLLLPLPGLDQFEKYETALLWDRLYPSLGAFYRALLDFKLPAVARFVVVFGLFEAEAVLGKKAWKLFPKYSRFIPPARRRHLQYLIDEVSDD